MYFSFFVKISFLNAFMFYVGHFKSALFCWWPWAKGQGITTVGWVLPPETNGKCQISIVFATWFFHRPGCFNDLASSCPLLLLLCNISPT